MVTVNGDVAEFMFFRPGARQVYLVGDFNHWRAGNTPMAAAGEGYWRARVRLPVGTFKFRYWADGQWFADYASFGMMGIYFTQPPTTGGGEMMVWYGAGAT